MFVGILLEYVCAPYMRLGPEEVRRRYWILWNWSYWVAVSHSRPWGDQRVLLTARLYLQSQPLLRSLRCHGEGRLQEKKAGRCPGALERGGRRGTDSHLLGVTSASELQGFRSLLNSDYHASGNT